MPYLQLIRHHRFPDESGRQKFYCPGDVKKIKNKKLAAQLIKDGFAIDASIQSKDMPDDAGILLRRKLAGPPAWVQAADLKMVTGKLWELPFMHTMVWDPAIKPNRRFIVPTFRLLRKGGWDVLAPVRSYDKLLRDLPLTEQKKETGALLHDLRIPYYQTRMFWAKRNGRVEALFAEWRDRIKAGTDERLAFMEAVYVTKPYILALPTAWVTKR